MAQYPALLPWLGLAGLGAIWALLGRPRLVENIGHILGGTRRLIIG